MSSKDRDDIRLLKSAKDIWADAQQILQKKLPTPSFQSWIKTTQLLEVLDGVATVGVSNDFMRTMVTNHLSAINEALTQVIKEPVTVRIVIDSSIVDVYTPTIGSITVMPPVDPVGQETTNASAYIAGHQSGIIGERGSSSQPPAMNAGGLSRANLSPKYTFDTFVVGSHNRFSHSAALAVAERPGQAYNPLFIYGGVGLGKTHIMQGIGHAILKHSPNLSVRYISCERFTNELINSIRDDRMMDFRKRYRQVDVLLVDDIQFIKGKESTQEEFFHTFNALRDSNRQIVLSSDRPPKAISLLEERLRSRFEWGLIADIQTPDLETRVAILRKKSEAEGMSVSDDVLEYIANVFTTNIRELEGALIRAHAYASLAGSPLTPATLAGILQPVGPAQKQKETMTVEKITDVVAAFYRVESSELRSSKRSHDLALPRHIAMYLAHELLKMSLPRIGQAFGNRRHTSALYAYQRIKESLDTDVELQTTIRHLTRELNA